MPPRNSNLILVALLIGLMCHVTARRAKPGILVGEAMNYIDRYYVEPVDRDQLILGAMRGMTQPLDPYSEYFPVEQYQIFQDSINQEFAGIGIIVEQPEPGQPVRVRSPLVGSPALRAGILPGDMIVRVEDTDVAAMPLADVTKLLKGPIGTSVNLVVLRDLDREVPITVQRANIEIESVIGDHRDEQDRWVFRLEDRSEIAYIRLNTFGEKSVDEFRTVLQRLDNDFDSLILDFRGNGGGLLYAAVEIADMFLNEGEIVSTRTRGDKLEESWSANPPVLVDPDKPIAVLIDGGSASASEIVAAALRDNGRAKVVGTRSFGKGTVQNVFLLEGGRSAFRLTVARYHRPNGKNIHRGNTDTEDDEWGVRPDEGMTVELDEDAIKRIIDRRTIDAYPSLRDGTGAIDDPRVAMQTIDPQLRRAVEAVAPDASAAPDADGQPGTQESDLSDSAK